MFRNLFDGPHLIIVLLVVVVLFGGKRLPDAARGLGRSLRIFKAEVKQMKDDDTPRRPANADAPSATEPLEGRVVDPEPGAPAPAAARAAEQRSDT